MLIETFTDKVKLFKLITGEEIITYSSFDGENYTFKKPLMCVLVTDPSNPIQGQVSFCPWVVCASHNLTTSLEKNKILAVMEADANAKNQYIASVGDIRE